MCRLVRQIRQLDQLAHPPREESEVLRQVWRIVESMAEILRELAGLLAPPSQLEPLEKLEGHFRRLDRVAGTVEAEEGPVKGRQRSPRVAACEREKRVTLGPK